MPGSEKNEKIKIIKKLIDIYEVTEEELMLLERDQDYHIHLNFAIAFITSAISASLTVLVESLSANTMSVFTGIIFSGYILGAMMLVLWYRKRSKFTNTINRIRQRRIRQIKEQEMELKKDLVVEMGLEKDLKEIEEMV